MQALDFIKTHKEAEEFPLIAYDGYELNLEDFKQKYPKVRIKLLQKNKK